MNSYLTRDGKKYIKITKIYNIFRKKPYGYICSSRGNTAEQAIERAIIENGIPEGIMKYRAVLTSELRTLPNGNRELIGVVTPEEEK